jgi:antitoxin CptB
MAAVDEVTRKRLVMRAWRRGLREMDLILGPFAEANLAAMDTPALAHFQALLDENDQDLMAWVLGQRPVPAQFSGLMARITAFARDRFPPVGPGSANSA